MQPELELVQRWLERARSDLHMAEMALEVDQPEPAGACFHCQQAVEKALKAVLVFHGDNFEWSHDIEYLLGRCIEQEQSFAQLLESAVPLSDYAVNFRYPVNEPDPTTERSREVLSTAREVWRFVLKHLPTQTHPRQ